ncbi:hypothetical protein D9Q98_003207 [Chlorella vulgaris]|uniref:galactinol--sucrose galactosyltransferase n=1 Tax=Chlorella vulgaris TaxID=3077 RepID=A0A9D4TSF2_CHLVU|nr:hypothetical protein D9Q98_003207 [Chlorella vulgaris]
MTLRLESGDDTVKSDYFEDAVLLAAGREPYALIEAAVTAAAALSGGARPLRDKQLPPNLDVFGWCSWDSFYSAVSASGLSDAVQSLASGGTPPRWVVIDDGWQCTEVDEPYRNIPTEQLKQKMLKDRNVGEKPGDAAQREAYLEGEMEALGQAARDVPAGTAMGAYLQEIRASGPPEDDEAPSGVDYHSLARQHAISSSVEEGPASPAKAKAPYRPLVIRASSTIFQYIVGLIFGFFQAFIVIFYQWVVDPAEHGTWPVNLFTYLTTGPLKGSMLQFFADSTNFTRRLTDVKANSKFSSPYASPDDISSGRREDLKAVVDHLRNRFNVDYVYCWHGLSAYWSGVSPDSAAVSKYGPKLHFPKPTPGLSEIEPSTAWNPGILGGVSIANNVDELFSDMHAYLSAAGISGVKVDCQAGVGLVGSALGGGPAAALKAHSALEDSIATHFKDNHAINCMCHSTENIYRWRDTAVARASDDFYPTDRASHIPHLAACAFNGVFLSPLALPDWDMFSSRHVAAEIHATARAVCGGPVYVSDAPGSHAFDVLRRLVLPDGSILRAKLPGRPTRDSLFRDVMRDGDTLLKIWNMNATGGIVGVFNLQGASWDRSRRRFHIHDSTKPELEALVRPTDVEVFRQQLEAAGCDVAGMLAAAAAAAAAEAAAGAQREAKLRQSSSSSSSSSSNSGAKRGSAAQRGSEQSLRVPLLAATRADGGSGSGSLAGSMLGSMDAVSSGSADDDTGSSPAGPPSAGVPASASASTSAASTATALGNGAGRGGNNGQPSSSNGNRNGSNGSSGTSSFVSSARASSSRRSAVSMPGLVAGGGVWDEDEEGGGAPSAAVPDFAVYVGATEELHRVSWDQGVLVSLEGWQGTVVTLAPISRFEYGGSSSHGLEFAAIGLSNMLNGGGAVCSVHAERLSPDGSMTQDTGRDDQPAGPQSPEQLLVHLTVRGRGTLLAYSSRRPQSCFVDGFEVAFHHVGERLSVEVPQVGSLHAGRSEQALVISY